MFTVKLDLGDLSRFAERQQTKARVLAEHAAENLAAQCYAKIVELASARLRSTRMNYLEALSYGQVDANTWEVVLDKSAMWIEEGLPRHEMIDDLLAGGANISKRTGARYRIIPFPIKSPSQTAAAAMPIRQAAMAAVRKAGINMKQIEREVDGRVKQGKLHNVPVASPPLKTAEGPFQGHGAIGQPRQGMGGTHFLSGMRVMQRQVGLKTGSPILKTAVTFRVVSSLHKGTGRWVHPGLQAKKLMDEAYSWAQQEWDTKILPEIQNELESG